MLYIVTYMYILARMHVCLHTETHTYKSGVWMHSYQLLVFAHLYKYIARGIPVHVPYNCMFPGGGAPTPTSMQLAEGAINMGDRRLPDVHREPTWPCGRPQGVAARGRPRRVCTDPEVFTERGYPELCWAPRWTGPHSENWGGPTMSQTLSFVTFDFPARLSYFSFSIGLAAKKRENRFPKAPLASIPPELNASSSFWM